MTNLNVRLVRGASSAIYAIGFLLVNCSEHVQLSAQDPSRSAPLVSYEVQRGLAFAEKLRTEQSQATAGNSSAPTTTSAPPGFDQRIESIQAETKQHLAELSSLEQDILAMQKSIAALEELTRLNADFVKDEPMVRHYLSALFNPGYTQPDKGSKHKRTDKVGPVSLEALRKFGALEPTEEGMLKLGHAGSDASNDRGRQAFPKNIGGALDQNEFDFLLPAQKYLIKYQKLLVHNGLLAP